MNNGGPAFPGVEHHYERDGSHEQRWVESYDGMSLRDYFAGQALIGITLAASIAKGELFDPAQAGQAAYNFADAMLEARDAAEERK